MPCTVLVAARSADGARAPMLSHSYDHIGNVDFRLAKIPPASAAPDAPATRAVLRMEELDVPREIDSSGASGSAIYAQLPGPDSLPIGEVPGHDGATFGYLEAASGIMNDAGVAMAECTCSSIFGALPVDKGGKALLNYMELTRIALERARTAREAILTMGSLAEEFGFFGNDVELGGSAENLAVSDCEEAWLFHILPDDTGASTIWAAQRVPDGHATCCANMFTIRSMDLEDPENFLYSASALEVATRLELWAPGTPFDFARTQSPSPTIPCSATPAVMPSGRAHLLTRSRNLAHAYHQASTPTASLRSTPVVESGARFRCSHRP
jgi:dipeptidase